MKIVSVKQNSKEWREWRGMGLGASDAPAYMGDSPWTTPFELWLQKTGLMERPEPNVHQLAAMKRGTAAEPFIRIKFEKMVGAEFPPLSAHHDTYEFLRASFDGHNSKLNAIFEAKKANKKDYETALKGKVPTKYVAQVQKQLLISGAQVCYFVVEYGDNDPLAIVEVRPDEDYQKKLLETAIDFWARVCGKILPDIKTSDVAKIVASLNKALESANKASIVLSLLTKEEN